MSKRQFSMIEYYKRYYENHVPQLSFSGTTKAEWEAWYKEAHMRLVEALGDYPEKVDPAAEIEYSLEEDGLIRERVVFDSEEFMSVPAIVLRPKDMKQNGKNAAIVCSHGHGRFGKNPVANALVNPHVAEDIASMNYNYGYQMAKEGFLCICPDLRNFGERSDGGNPYPGRDICNINFLIGALTGNYTLTRNIWDIKCCIDYLETRPEVDKNRIGMMGLSQGGTMTTFTTAVEPRIKAADIIGYVNPWYQFAIKRNAFCGSQMVPEIYKYLDVPDIAGLIAPRPLLIEMGAYDSCFYIADLLKGYEQVEKIYNAAGASDMLDKDIGLCEHAFVGNKAAGFFKKYL